ncbi:Uncharacterised protein [Mycobacteroides abscessus subsp. abscessus]|nr:Uncharacterised protein [Mycobacteroides abscessus subsp. abscessus]
MGFFTAQPRLQVGAVGAAPLVDNGDARGHPTS